LWADKIENTFVGVFDSLLDRQRYEVLNFGVGGYGLWDIKLQLIEQVLAFAPDFVFLMVFTGNDVRDTYLGLNKYEIVAGTAKLKSANYDELIPHRGKEDQLIAKNVSLLDAFRVYRFFTATLNYLRTSRSSIDFVVSDRFTSYTFWSQVPYPEIATKALEATLRVLDDIGRICEENGITLVIATIPFKDQVYATNMRGAGYDVTLPQRYVIEHARSRGYPVVDLLPALRAYVRETRANLYLDTDPHLNNAGHLKIGQLLDSYFRKEFVGHTHD
jgi:hypothetical protein